MSQQYLDGFVKGLIVGYGFSIALLSLVAVVGIIVS